jgi:PadR family transcriptional regulator, regulatory protein PadR
MVGTFVGVPIAEPTFFILSALTEQPLHGYGVMLTVRRLSDGRVNLRPGTLYAALDRLTEDGLLVVDRTEADNGRLRRYYRLTDAGAATLATEVERLRVNAAMAAERLRHRGAGRPALGGAR